MQVGKRHEENAELTRELKQDIRKLRDASKSAYMDFEHRHTCYKDALVTRIDDEFDDISFPDRLFANVGTLQLEKFAELNGIDTIAFYKRYLKQEKAHLQDVCDERGIEL